MIQGEHAIGDGAATATGFAGRCLPGDIELLTDAGWERGMQLRTGDLVAVWNPETGDVALEPAADVAHGSYEGDVIALVGAGASATGNPERGIWVRTPNSGDTWTPWHRRSLGDLRDLAIARIAVAGHHSGPGLRNDGGDYAGALGWISVEEGYHGTNVHIRLTDANRDRAIATARRLAALGGHLKRVPGSGGVTVDAWFIPGPLTATLRHDLIRGVIRWPAVWKMNSVELHAFVDGAMGGRRHTLHRLERGTVDVIQAIGAMTGHRTTAHDVGSRAGATVEVGIGVDAPMSHDAIKRRVDSWSGPAFSLRTRTGAVVARRNGRVFIAATWASRR